MDKSKILSYLRKTFPTVLQEYSKEIDGYLRQIEGVTDTLAKEMVTQYIINKLNKKKDGRL